MRFGSLCSGIEAASVAWHSLGKPAADGQRYKALGNSWAVNCARWIGRRIEMVDQINAARKAAA